MECPLKFFFDHSNSRNLLPGVSRAQAVQTEGAQEHDRPPQNRFINPDL
jgi:hypothetical protein